MRSLTALGRRAHTQKQADLLEQMAPPAKHAGMVAKKQLHALPCHRRSNKLHAPGAAAADSVAHDEREQTDNYALLLLTNTASALASANVHALQDQQADFARMKSEEDTQVARLTADIQAQQAAHQKDATRMRLVHAEPVRVQQARKDIQAAAEVASMKARSVRLKADQADIDLEDTGAHVVTAKQVANAKLRRATSSMLGAIILFAFVSTKN